MLSASIKVYLYSMFPPKALLHKALSRIQPLKNTTEQQCSAYSEYCVESFLAVTFFGWIMIKIISIMLLALCSSSLLANDTNRQWQFGRGAGSGESHAGISDEAGNQFVLACNSEKEFCAYTLITEKKYCTSREKISVLMGFDSGVINMEALCRGGYLFFLHVKPILKKVVAEGSRIDISVPYNGSFVTFRFALKGASEATSSVFGVK